MKSLALPPARVSAMPCCENWLMTLSSIETDAAARIRMPMVPGAEGDPWTPLSCTPPTITFAPAALMVMPGTPAARIDPSVKPQFSVIDLVMVTVPKPPGSRQLISPAVAVLEIAPGNVLQGAVRLHGLASSPTPETQVRVACAWAAVEKPTTSVAANKKRIILELFI